MSTAELTRTAEFTAPLPAEPQAVPSPWTPPSLPALLPGQPQPMALLETDDALPRRPADWQTAPTTGTGLPQVHVELSGFDTDDDDLEEDAGDDLEEAGTGGAPKPAVDDDDLDEFDEIDEDDFDDDFDDDFEEELNDDYEIEIDDEISAEFGLGKDDDDDDLDDNDLDLLDEDD